MSIKHEAQYKKLKLELDLEIKLKDLKQRKAFCDLQCFSLREQHFALLKKGTSLTFHSHPMCNLEAKSKTMPSFLKITPCVICLRGF